ncbi:MAG: pirin family protein [Ectothiorhodospiraceae bacterium]|nr:pirin family protein [Ectothiorhodospiraceae bacterium]
MNESVMPARTQHLVDDIHVRRVLPRHHCRMVGPFVFLDHLSPDDMPPDQELYVPPHAHAGLETVTYLLSGALLHRDSLGTRQEIRPGDVNWMTAGRGIAHIEDGRSSAVESNQPLHLAQVWVALPADKRDIAPAFVHHPAQSLPEWEDGGAHIRLLAGQLSGQRSPVLTHSPLAYVDLDMAAGASLALDVSPAFELAIYVIEGELTAAGVDGAAEPCELMRLPQEDYVRLQTGVPTRALLLGGEPLDPRPVVRDNCALDSLDAIKAFQADYKAGKFGRIA